MNLKIAVNLHYSDKFDSDKYNRARKIWRHFNGSFVNRTLSTSKWMQHILKGHPYTAQHRLYRKRDNFICAQHLATDHDTNDYRSSFEFILEDAFVQEYAYALHSTPSHTDKTPRTRVIYILDKPIANSGKYALLAAALCDRFEHADKSVKDPCRFFFGHKDGNLHKLGNILTVANAAKLLVAPFQEKQMYEQPIKPSFISNSNSSSLLKYELDKLASAPDGEKYYTLLRVSRTLGGYVGGGYLNEFEVRRGLTETIQRRRINSRAIAMAAINSGVTYGIAEPLFLQDEWDVIGLEI